ncbi:MAG: VWA domain-containing protein [Spirochaetales bacterium]|nr:VWA domain-containing protein [Spirochaetales bacterium]
MLNLEYPVYLVLFLALPPAVYLVHFRRRRGGVIRFNFTIWKENGFKQKVNAARIFEVLLWIFFWIGFSLLIVAFSGPVVVEKEKIFLTTGIDMVIVLDESPSMAAPDFEPRNRYETAKDVIRSFTQSRENDQIGLVTFSSEAVLRVPPTLHYEILEQTLEELQIMELGEGTAIGMGIAVAVLHLKSSRAREKVIILLTDGVNNEGKIGPEEAALAASGLGIRVYTIGIGKESDIEWTIKDPKTGIEYKGWSGEFDEKLLKKIADLTGGKYYYAGDPWALNAVFEEIDSKEKTEKRVRMYVNRTPRHEIFIILGFLMVVLSFIGRKWFLQEMF